MIVTSLNLNGIRAAWRKGWLNWLKTHAPDVVCTQETRISDADLIDEQRNPLGYHGYFNHAQKKGYSGVNIYSKQPVPVQTGIDHAPFDDEGRVIQANYHGLSVISAYLPSGSSSEERHAIKLEYLVEVRRWLDGLMAHSKATGHQYIVCGDWNIAHHNIDIKNWRGNLKNSGFTPEERAWLTSLFDDGGWVDVFRQLNQEEGQFTWWSNRGQAWANNTGWRIDYHIATPGIAALARSAEIYKDERFSDHAPLTINYDYTLTT